MKKTEYFARILPSHLPAPKTQASVYAPANIALSKYWGKRDVELNLPTNGSLSISLAHLGTRTTISPADTDNLTLNGAPVDLQSAFAQKVFRFVAYFRRETVQPLAITTVNTIPTAAGLASSASGFAALTLALNDYWQLHLSDSILSTIARIGSGSAARSLWHGFVKWHRGENKDGSDSVASPLMSDWQSLRIGLLEIDIGPKKVSSRLGMTHTVQTSPLYHHWPTIAENDLLTIERAIAERDFVLLGETSEANALTMHATMLAARPALSYFQAETFATLQKIWQVRAQGLEVYATIDAGPNVKLLYQEKQQSDVEKMFPQAIFINPFDNREYPINL